MKMALAGAVVLIAAVAGCGRKDKPADDGMGAGAAPPVVDDSAAARNMTPPRDSTVPHDSAWKDSTYRKQ